jgi:chromosome segregation ATPase
VSKEAKPSIMSNKDDITNLDPTVAALLEPCDTDDVSQLRTRIALMKLQQARIRGNSDYAAKIMEHAIEEGARDKQAWELLDDHIRKLDEQVKAVPEKKKDDEKEKEEEKEEKEEDGDKETTEEKDDKEEKEGSDEVTSEQVEKLKKEVEAEKERANTMEDLLVDCLEEELGSVRKEQESIQEREARLKARIRSLQETVQKLPQEATKSLQQDLNEIQSAQCILTNAQCSVCHEHSATKAVIPCGHLCMCEECNNSVIKLDTAQRKCPLCRGQLLSTLRIYTSK